MANAVAAPQIQSVSISDASVATNLALVLSGRASAERLDGIVVRVVDGDGSSSFLINVRTARWA